MKVALDVWHTRQTAAGTARYSGSLAEAIRARGDVDLVEIGSGQLVAPHSVRKKLLTLRQDLFWYPFAGRRRAEAVGADIYHCPAMRSPLTSGRIPLIVTVHDLVALRFPETMPRWTRAYTRVTMGKALAAADLLITPSADTANDLEILAGVAPERIRVVWNGAADIFFGAVLAPKKEEPYVLFVGTREPRKNLSRLISAMGALRRKGFLHRLVVAGGRGWGGTVAAAPHVEFRGELDDVALHVLYAGAACTVLPSLHEGFGLPAVESMASGTPVVAARVGALPEILGNAGVLVDPLDENAIARGIAECLGNRTALAAKARERAKIFRWSTAAEQTVAAYRELA